MSVCFIDLGELDQRARNRGDYTLGSVGRRIYSFDCESVLMDKRASLCGMYFLL
jgi:hypothetical protein